MSDRTGEPEAAAGDEDLLALRALAGRLGGESEGWELPPDGLWDRIAAEAGVEAHGSTSEPAGSTETTRTTGPSAPTGTAAGATVHPLGDRARRRTPGARGPRLPWILAAAAAAAVVVVVGTLAMLRTSGDDTTVVASVPLERLQDQGTGTAELVEQDGSLELHLDTEGLDAGDGFLEVWVIDTEVTKLVSLGPLRGDGVYDLPPGVDPEAYPVVDVSVEPVDGDPTHSGDSVLRGQLTF